MKIVNIIKIWNNNKMKWINIIKILKLKNKIDKDKTKNKVNKYD